MIILATGRSIPKWLSPTFSVPACFDAGRGEKELFPALYL